MTGMTAGAQIGVNAASSAIGGVIGLANTALQHRYNKKLADYQNDINIQNWNMQNEYNSPAEQRKRLEQAGLNPAQMYGNGATSTTNAGNIPAYQQAGVDISSNMLNAMQMAQMAATIRNTEADTAKKESEREGIDITNSSLSEMNQAIIANYLSKTDVNKAEVKVKEKTLKKMDLEMSQISTNIDVMLEDISMKKAQTDSIKEQTKLTQLQQLTEVAKEVYIREQAKTEKVKRVNIGADTDLKVAQAVNQYSQANLADSQSKKVNADTFYQECRNLYYREYGVFPDANGDNFLMQLCTTDAEGLGTTKAAYFGEKALNHVEKLVDIFVKGNIAKQMGRATASNRAKDRAFRRRENELDRELKRELAKTAAKAVIKK